MAGGDEQIFNAVLGASQFAVVLSHSAGSSATKWADILGQYEKMEESYSTSKGGSYSFGLLPNPNYNNTVNLNRKREHVVLPEQITRMRETEAYVYRSQHNELAHIFLNV